MSTGALLGIALGAIIVLLLLVIKIQLSAFVSLLLVAAGTAKGDGQHLIFGDDYRRARCHAGTYH